MLLFSVVGCSGPDDAAPAVVGPPLAEVVYLDAPEHLWRVSMALRGIRPSLADLDAVRADPGAVDEIVDAYLESPEFGEVMKDLHAELLLVRTDTDEPLPAMGPLSGSTEGAIYQSRAETPLELIRYVITEDRPYTEIVTADYMLVDATGALVWGIPFDPDGDEWQTGWWTDGRPPAGILSDSTLWMRFTSAGNNYQRSRANFVARALLCEDFATRDIAAQGLGLNEAEEVASAIATNPECTACHHALDPLAGFMWGFNQNLVRQAVFIAYETWDCTGISGDRCYPLRFFHPGAEDGWADLGLPAPAYYGVPGEGLQDLGALVAADPRFAQCTAKNFFAYLTQAERDEVPHEIAVDLQDAFVASGYRAKELAKAIVLSDEFRAVRTVGEGEPPHLVSGLQVIRPEQYARTLEDLTGWQYWVDAGAVWGNDELIRSDRFGFRSMQGGIDGFYVTRASHTAIPTKLLAMERLAAEAAGYVVTEDFGVPAGERRLLTRIEADDSSEVAVRAQLVDLHARVLGEVLDADSVEIDASWGLWSVAFDRGGDPVVAWKLVLAGVFQDVRMIYY